MNLRKIIPAVALLVFGFCSQGMSQTYTLGFDQGNYQINTGDTVDVEIILTEVITGAEVSRLAAGLDDGLFSFGNSVDFSSFMGLTGSSYSSFVINPDFNFDFTGTGSGVTEGIGEVSFEATEDFGLDSDGEDGVGGVEITPTLFQLSLGTMTFDAGSGGSVTTLQLQDHTDVNANDFLFADGATPPLNFGSATITVVPEPGSATAIALLAGFGLIRRRRK